LSSIIKVSNLGKKYIITHNQPRRRGYRRLSEDLTKAFSWPIRRWRADPSVLINGQSKREEFWALRDVSFEVTQGEVVGIIGRNGAGKSTLLKLLSRITEPTTGRIELYGRVASLLEVGTGFHPELTGRENIFLNGAILGMTRAEIIRKFDEIVAFAEVERFLDTPVKRYSSGMYVRLAFAVAAHLEPEILVVDEVLAVGDAEFQNKCLGKMENVSLGGRTVLFVSHNMSAIRRLCKRAIIMREGRIDFSGPTPEAIDAYHGMVMRSHEVAFKPDTNRPSITGVRVEGAAAKKGDLSVEISFASPFPLSPPVPGLVLYSSSGTPVYGTNARIHNDGYPKLPMDRGTLSFKAVDVPICTGRYRLSVWLGDWHRDYDHKVDTLTFDFVNPMVSQNHVSAEVIGHVHCPGHWCMEGARRITSGPPIAISSDIDQIRTGTNCAAATSLSVESPVPEANNSDR
jgi:lipopolysaccharide transport system ATP-binding protein